MTGSGSLDVAAAVIDRDVDVRLAVPAGQVVAVLGANGAGKSTLLGLLAGQLRPDHGRITLDGSVLVDTDRGTWVPAHRRRIGLLAQQALLFPHLTAAANVAFGPRSQGRGRIDARRVAEHWLDAVDAGQYADRTPDQLSGGQAQRIAIARALAADPQVLLLDEPMAALDVAVAPAIRQLLRRVLAQTPRTTLLVTHDLIDALTLADRTVVVEAGRIVEDGPTRSVLAAPRSAFTARIAGVNLVAGTWTGQHLITAGGMTVHGTADPACRAGDGAVAVFSPIAVAVYEDDPGGSPRNHLPAVVTELEPRGETVRVHTAPFPGSSGLLADITVAAAADLHLQPGERVRIAFKATAVTVHPAAR